VIAPETLIAGRYRLLRRLAAGGMGTVWLAQDERLDRSVAMKMLHPQPGLSAGEAELVSKRALREARLTARLHHPNAVPLYDVIEQDGQPCLIMQYLPSRSLQAILERSGRLAPPEVVKIGAQLASALAAAHQAGITHRDVKPGNVLITEDGTAKLTDFGISHALGDASLTSTGMVTGTPAYLAPEVARGADSGYASDVYSLGATLYAAIEGNPPFGSGENPMATLHKVASGRPNPPTRSGPLTPLLARMLAAEPAARPAMPEIARTLRAMQDDIAAAATAPAEAVRSPIPPLQQPVDVGSTAVLAGAAMDPTTPVARAVTGPAEPPPTDGRPRGVLIAALTALLAIGALVLAVVLLNHHGGNGTVSSKNSSPAGPTNSSAPRTTSRPVSSSAPSTSSAAHTTASSTSNGPPDSSAASGPGNGTPTAAQLAQAITDYYALLPDDTDRGWTLLTSRFRREHSLNKQAYESYWATVSQVSASDAAGSAPSTAQATINYTFKDGRIAHELTRFTLVDDHGVLKIDTQTVLNSG
jgi:eukaryotic-like serine/threonine-protein kinase